MQIPPRSHLIDRVRAALAAPNGPALYLHGGSSTGKEATLREAASGCRIIRVDCVLSHTERQLYSALCEQSDRVNSASALIDFLSSNNRNHSDDSSSELSVIIFARAERLASSTFPPSVLPFLATLPCLSCRPDIRVVFVSRVPFSTIRHTHTHLIPPMHAIHFPPLSEHEIIVALKYDPNRLLYPLDMSASSDEATTSKYYHGFARSVTEILYQSTNNPYHIQRVVDAFFPEYLDSLLHQSQKINPVAAFNRVRDRLTDVLKTLNPTLSSATTSATAEFPQRIRSRGSIEAKTANLSKICRTMLVASYLATVVQPAQDTRVFSTEQVNRRTVAQKSAANNAVPLERLLAIFHAVSTLDDDNNSSFPQALHVDSTAVSSAISTPALVHISTLVALGWLTRDGAAHSLSEPKFRCKLSRYDAGIIASTLGIQIEDYLIFDKTA